MLIHFFVIGSSSLSPGWYSLLLLSFTVAKILGLFRHRHLNLFVRRQAYVMLLSSYFVFSSLFLTISLQSLKSTQFITYALFVSTKYILSSIMCSNDVIWECSLLNSPPDSLFGFTITMMIICFTGPLKHSDSFNAAICRIRSRWDFFTIDTIGSNSASVVSKLIIDPNTNRCILPLFPGSSFSKSENTSTKYLYSVRQPRLPVFTELDCLNYSVWLTELNPV